MPPPRNRRIITLDELITLLANYALRDNSKNTSQSRTSFELNEILTILPSLAQGLDVNIKFTNGITGYEFTSQIGVFDFFNVRLIHGWLLDKQDAATSEAIGGRSYNELVGFMCSESERIVELEAIVKELAFLDEEEARKNLLEIMQVEKILDGGEGEEGKKGGDGGKVGRKGRWEGALLSQ